MEWRTEKGPLPYGLLFLPLMKIAGNAQFWGEFSIGQWAMYRWAAFWIALLKYWRVHYLNRMNWFLSPGTLFYSRGDLGKAIPCEFFQWLVFGAFQAILDIIHHICEILSRGKKEPETSGSQWFKNDINDKNLWDSYGFMAATNTTRKQRKLSKSPQISSENVAPQIASLSKFKAPNLVFFMLVACWKIPENTPCS